ncbi:MAG: 23S rRNA (guanosine(2251)-2'-O)-methyltransferase RlmB [Acholeplasmataceae bacterium]
MIIYGKNVVKEAILNDRKIYKLYVDNKLNDYKYKSFLEENNLNIIYEDKGFLNNLTNNAVHNGVVAEVKPYQYKTLEEVIDKTKKQVFLMLDEIYDPHNLGAIIRTSEAAKIDGIIIGKKHQVPITGAVVKTSSGAIEHMNLILVSNLYQVIRKLKENNFYIIGSDLETKHSYKEIPNNKSLLLIVGSEDKGLRTLLKRDCDLIVKIPMKGKVNSLNVSVAAALLIYETL